MYQTSFGQVVLTLGRFLRKDMAFESMFPLDFAGTGEGKPLSKAISLRRNLPSVSTT